MERRGKVLPFPVRFIPAGSGKDLPRHGRAEETLDIVMERLSPRTVLVLSIIAVLVVAWTLGGFFADHF